MLLFDVVIVVVGGWRIEETGSGSIEPRHALDVIVMVVPFVVVVVIVLLLLIVDC